MKKKRFLFPLLMAFALTGCSFFSNSSDSLNVDDTLETTDDGPAEYAGDAYDYNQKIELVDPDDIVVEEITSAFEISTSDGSYSQNENVYTLTGAGTYTLSGKLVGQILVEAGDSNAVEIALNGASISYGLDSPIKVVSAKKVEISAKSGTGNIVTDTRSHKVVEDENQGEGAISAKTDLKLKGNGTLVVTGNYNNGVHTTKDLTIKNETLKAVGYNNGIKGKNSVTIESGNIQAYAETNNGIKTDESDLTSKGKQKGTVSIVGGSVYVNSLRDGIDASYNIEVSEADSEAPTSILVKAGKQSKYWTNSTVADSEKGLKAQNDIVVDKGTILVAASDDALHANYGETLGTNELSTGNITINDGIIQVASGDDGIHADNTLTINGGGIRITGSTEGLEANYIVINGGSTYVYGTDDGVNASKKSFSDCSFTMTGGYLDVAVRSGDTDGIDSNGDVTISGGIIITRGSPENASNMSTGLDVDGTCTMTGGTLIAFNGLEKKPTTSSGVLYAATNNATSGGGQGGGPGGPGGGGPGGGGRASSSSSYAFPGGEYNLSGTSVNISFTNDYAYSNFLIYSSSLTSGATYTLTRSEATVKSWTQSSNSVTIS